MDLHQVAREGNVARVRELLDDGVAVDALDRWDNTALIEACFSETHHPDVVALLRERGADPRRRNFFGMTARGRAYARFELSGFDPLADLPAPEPRKTYADQLTEAEMAAVVGAVRAVVKHDRSAMEAMNAYEYGDPYEFTYRWAMWDAVHLVMPPGDPRTWVVRVYRSDEDGDLPDEALQLLPPELLAARDACVPVEVDMWTREEGRSQLTLELELQHQPDGRIDVEFQNLLVQ